MKDSTIFVEVGGYIINLDLVAYITRDDDTLNVAFAAPGAAGPMCIILNGQDADKFTAIFRSNRTVIC
jgi:hypothetical protein